MREKYKTCIWCSETNFSTYFPRIMKSEAQEIAKERVEEKNYLILVLLRNVGAFFHQLGLRSWKASEF
jgi:hypothetical protein